MINFLSFLFPLFSLKSSTFYCSNQFIYMFISIECFHLFCISYENRRYFFLNFRPSRWLCQGKQFTKMTVLRNCSPFSPINLKKESLNSIIYFRFYKNNFAFVWTGAYKFITIIVVVIRTIGRGHKVTLQPDTRQVTSTSLGCVPIVENWRGIHWCVACLR